MFFNVRFHIYPCMGNSRDALIYTATSSRVSKQKADSQKYVYHTINNYAYTWIIVSCG